jgi:hypothetical protein
MKFLELHERLRLETWRRIDQGILSSSLLARQTGLAQAHISNFLHRRRRLSLDALDRVLLAEALTLEDLEPNGRGDRLDGFPKTEPGAMDTVPVVSQVVAMNSPAIVARAVVDTVHLPAGWLSGFPARRAVSRRSWERFVGVRVSSAQALPMDPVLQIGSIVVIDRHYTSLVTLRPPTPNLYAVRAGPQCLFRHVAFEASRLVLRPRALSYPVELIELDAAETPSDLLVGRVCLCISEL